MNRTACPLRANTTATTATALARRLAYGLSLVELMCTLAIAMLLLSGAVPTLRDMHARQLLLASAASLEVDVHFARSLALSSDAPVRLSIQAQPAGGSCTVVHTGPAHACRCSGNGQAVCTDGAQLHRLSEQPFAQGITIIGAARSLVFDPNKGTITPTATVTIADADGRAVRKIVNIMGRMRSCAVGGVAGFAPCA